MSVHVSPDNFIRAESDLYFGNVVRAGELGQFLHYRDFGPLDDQLVVRQNRDTLYSAAVFDLDAGPVTVTVPDGGSRFVSLQVITEDHYVPQVSYAAGEHTFDRSSIGTRYVMLALRILVDPADPADVAAMHALQDAVVVEQTGAEGYFTPNAANAYSVNDITAAKGSDGTVTVQFGGCEDDTGTANCLPVTPGWNYLVRLYRPRPEVLDGSWTFPAAEPV